MRDISGILFDKDGTLFDFNATWGTWTEALLIQEAAGDLDLVAHLSRVLGYDLAEKRFFPDSVVIAETVEGVADKMLPFLPQADKSALIGRMNALSEHAPQIEAAPLAPFFAGLRARGLRVGVVTNDAEAPARAHLDGAGVLDALDFVAGYDSGHGAKPAPGALLAFCAAMGLRPAACAMVGDSLHDLNAGKAAGFTTIGVLTGPANRQALEQHADVVLDSIADLPAWLVG